jgi:hypothetical protein
MIVWAILGLVLITVLFGYALFWEEAKSRKPSPRSTPPSSGNVTISSAPSTPGIGGSITIRGDAVPGQGGSVIIHGGNTGSTGYVGAGVPVNLTTDIRVAESLTADEIGELVLQYLATNPFEVTSPTATTPTVNVVPVEAPKGRFDIIE